MIYPEIKIGTEVKASITTLEEPEVTTLVLATVVERSKSAFKINVYNCPCCKESVLSGHWVTFCQISPVPPSTIKLAEIIKEELRP